MSDKLVTLESYSNALEAEMAKNRLNEAGIRATLANGTAVTALSHLSNAMGGVKVQVFEDDLARACEVLSAVEEHSDAPGDANSRDGHAATSTPAEDQFPEGQTSDAEENSSSDEVDLADADDVEREPTRREQDAGRAFRAAILGLICFPVQLYASWLLCKVFMSDELIDAPARRRAWWAAAINVPIIFVLCVGFRYALAH